MDPVRSYELHEKLTQRSGSAFLYRARAVTTDETVVVRLIKSSMETLYKVRWFYDAISKLPNLNVLPLIDSFTTQLPLALSRDLIEERETITQDRHSEDTENHLATVSPIDDMLHSTSSLLNSDRKTGICLVFPYCTNGSLFSAMERQDNQPLSEIRNVQILTQVAHGLHVLHLAKHMHGNLSSRNVLLDLNQNVWLSGLDRQFYEPIITNQQRMEILAEVELSGGSWNYQTGTIHAPIHIDETAPPECGGKVGRTFAMDIWHLGVLAYSLSTGHAWLSPNLISERISLLRQRPSPWLTGESFSTEIKSFIMHCSNEAASKRPTIRDVHKHALLITFTGSLRETTAYTTSMYPAPNGLYDEHGNNRDISQGAIRKKPNERRRSVTNRSQSLPGPTPPQKYSSQRSKSLQNPRAILAESTLGHKHREVNLAIFTKSHSSVTNGSSPGEERERDIEPVERLSDPDKPLTNLFRRIIQSDTRCDGDSFSFDQPFPTFDGDLVISLASRIDSTHVHFMDDLRDVVYRLLRDREHRS